MLPLSSLPGVNFDLENLATGFIDTVGGVSAQQVVAWLVAASNAARAVLGPPPCGGFITHAPQVSAITPEQSPPLLSMSNPVRFDVHVPLIMNRDTH
jgi:hypothetical protein